MTDRELMQQALEALEAITYRIDRDLEHDHEWAVVEREIASESVTALRERLEQQNEFSLDWHVMAGMVEEQQRMATEIDRLKDVLNKSESRLHEVAVHCERVEQRLKDVNTAAISLTDDIVSMDYYDDERLDRDEVMDRIMQWRNQWDKAMFEERNK